MLRSGTYDAATLPATLASRRFRPRLSEAAALADEPSVSLMENNILLVLFLG
jgi:hypothetical protein